MTAFDVVELDLLATHAGVRFPFPLRVQSVGRFGEERAALLADAGRKLRERGLADEYGPQGVAHELVSALTEHRSAVDLVVVNADQVIGAVAMIYGDKAVVCCQAGDTVEVTRVDAAELSDELAALIPAAKAAQTMPITVPPGVVERAAGVADTPEARQVVRDLVRARGGDPRVVDQLAELLPKVTGRGQLGRMGQDRREVSWLDGPRGRVRVDQGSDGWVSVNPVRQHELVRALGQMTSDARK